MRLTLPPVQLAQYVAAQVNTFFPDGENLQHEQLLGSLDGALSRLDYCFSHVALSHYYENGQSKFDHLHSDQYLMFLWFLSNQAWQDGLAKSVLDKLYLLNKYLHAFDCMYNTSLPEIFIIVHGVGTVLGKANYKNFLAIHQNCTIGASRGSYPCCGFGLGLGAGASLLGKSQVGSNVTIGASTCAVNINIPEKIIIVRNRNGEIIMNRQEEIKNSLAYQYFGDALLNAQPV